MLLFLLKRFGLLYDETTMPPELRKAHQQNDKAVMVAYGFWGKLNSEPAPWPLPLSSLLQADKHSMSAANNRQSKERVFFQVIFLKPTSRMIRP